MTTLCAYLLGEHSDIAQSNIIREHGYEAWWTAHVTPAIKAIRKLGRDPVVIHRFPGAAFGSYRVTLADFLAVRGTDWASTVKRQTMRPYRWPWQAPRAPVEYRAYLPEPQSWGGSEGMYRDGAEFQMVLNTLSASKCGAYFEGVRDDGYSYACVCDARDALTFVGAEPFWDLAYPRRWQDPCIVAERMLTDEGRDFRGKNWNPSWVPLAPGQRRTLIMDDAPVSMAAILEREAEGWDVAVYAHRLVEMTRGTT